MKRLIVFYFLIFGLFACKKTNSESSCKYDALPNSLILKITKNGKVLDDSILADCKLYYNEGLVKKYVNDFTFNNLEAQYKGRGLISSRRIGILSADYNIKTFYIEYAQSWPVDTLSIDYLKPMPSNNCLYLQNTVNHSGVAAAVDSSFLFNSPVFIIAKP